MRGFLAVALAVGVSIGAGVGVLSSSASHHRIDATAICASTSAPGALVQAVAHDLDAVQPRQERAVVRCAITSDTLAQAAIVDNGAADPGGTATVALVEVDLLSVVSLPLDTPFHPSVAGDFFRFEMTTSGALGANTAFGLASPSSRAFAGPLTAAAPTCVEWLQGALASC